MVKISNKPNVRGIKSVSESTKYRSQLIAREGRLFGGLHATRIKGMAIGLIISLALVGIPLLLSGVL